MSFVTAFERLSALRIEGIRSYYDISALPGVLLEADLPARLLEVDYIYDNAIVPLGFDFEEARFSAFVQMKLLVRFQPSSFDPARVADIPLWYDRYIRSFAGDWTLGGALLSPVATDVMRAGLVDWLGMSYLGCVFRIRLVIRTVL